MNKELSLSGFVSRLEDGMTIGFGGWGPRRKPMALVREIIRSPLKDLTLVAFGGPEIGMLCAAGKVKKLIYGFVSLDAIPIEPYFRKAREAGSVEVSELDEGLLRLGLMAAAQKLDFLPSRVGFGTDFLTYNPHVKTIRSPYSDAQYVAMPAIKLDAALIHVSRADRLGNTQTDGPDAFFDEWFARAATAAYASCEDICDRLDAHPANAPKANVVERSYITGVIHAPFGAHPTTSHERYGWDMGHFKDYVASAAEPDGWQRYRSTYIGASEAAYQSAVGGADAIAALPVPAL